MKAKYAEMVPSTPTASPRKQRLASNGQTFTPPNASQRRAALGEIESNEQRNAAPSNIGVQDDNLPAPTPGQPRKTSKLYGTGSTRQSPSRIDENEPFTSTRTTAEVRADLTRYDGESDEEYHLRQIARRTSSRSPARTPNTIKEKTRRAFSTTSVVHTSVTHTSYGFGEGSDTENTAPATISGRPKTPTSKVGSGISVGKVRANTRGKSTEGKTSIRKTSGRVGSVGSTSRPKP
jgi:cell division cycle 14